jgi:hypothetical protein
MLEGTLLQEVHNVVPDPTKKNEYLIELMKKKSQAGAGMLKYSQNVLNCVRVYRVVKPKSDLVAVKTAMHLSLSSTFMHFRLFCNHLALTIRS